ncbi:NADH-quinone oxidoreductase subunit C [bacterium]|nr:NADH-quinone oxidoreductase subunit C [bacterium]
MEKLKQEMETAFDGLDIAITYPDNMGINVDRNVVVSILTYLKGRGYCHLALISCVDWIEVNEFELVYILSAYMSTDDEYTEKEKQNIIVKTRIPRDKPNYMTIIELFENAEPYEREIHELFGIHFVGHPRLTPLFLELKYEKPPFRKDFDTEKFVNDFFGNIPSVD